MISTGSAPSPYYRLDSGPTAPSVVANASSTGNSTNSGPAGGNFTRSASQAAPPSSTPFPIAPAPLPMAQPMMHPAPLAPYPQQAPSMHVHGGQQGAQSQIICSGCRTLLVYPNNASNVRCALCTTVTPVPPAGTEMAQLVCGGCRTLLMYVRGASSVQCSCCHTVNLAMETNQIAHINCGGCAMTLMYSFGAHSVKCAVCQFITSAGGGPNRVPLPLQRPPYAGSQTTSTQQPQSQASSGRTQTVVVENPMTLDDSGKLVNSVSVGVTTEKKS